MPRRNNRTALPDNIRLRRIDEGRQEVLEGGKPIGRVFRTAAFNQDGSLSRSDHWAWRDLETGDTDGGGSSGRQAAGLLLRHRNLQRNRADRDGDRRRAAAHAEDRAEDRAKARANARADRIERGIRGGRVNGRMR